MMPAHTDDFDDSDLESGDERDPLTRDHDGNLIRGVLAPTPAWDSFRNLPPETETENEEGEIIYRAVIKFVKLLVYLLTFLVVLAGAVFAKGSLFLMTSQLEPNRRIGYCNPNFGLDRHFEALTPEIERIGWYWVIFFAFSVPELGTLIRSLRIGFFKGWKKPTFVEFFIPFVFETLHAIGLGLFVFVALPSVDVVKGVMLTNCLCVIPALLGLFAKTDSDKNKKDKWFLKGFLDSFVTVFQITGLLLWPLLSINTFPRPWVLPIAGILTSFGWWENYVDKDSPAEFIRYLGEMRMRLRETRYYSYVYISVWKMCIFLGVMCLSVWIVDDNVENLFSNFVHSFQEHQISVSEVRPPVIPNASPTLPGTPVLPAHFNVTSEYGAVQWALYIQILAAYLCYVFGKFACKICIQGVSFALPVSLAVPTTLVVLIGFCGMRSDNTCLWKNTLPGYLFWTCPEGDFLEDFVTKEYSWVWLLWLFSQAWITRHIWTPTMDRLLSTEKLQVTPMYCSLMIDQSLTLNRKRDNRRELYSVNDEESKDNEDDADNNETVEFDEDTHDDDAFPHIIACATMWHENKEEMVEMLKSIFRMDIDQCARRIFKNTFGVKGKGYYEFETHIFFDDAFELRDSEVGSPEIVNPFVKLMVETVEEAACYVHEKIITIRPPTKIPTPYGGRLEWILPGKTKLIAHLKNKDKIRHKKRWSQIMYMYYLLGYKLMELDISTSRKDVIAENTYLLALDGDIDFQPNAVELLVDLMKKNKNLGAACGRIHPIGSGPMVWYQKFEYAIGHWLQKATEHMIGCVLCSPGCFSLFRAKALMEDNVMKKYTTMSEEPRHYVQYDQGEDRWLCTLLLQRGYRVEYSAASDAKTHAPESFNEFYNQRRRWVPSTMANIFDLLMDSRQTIRNNPDISKPYIFYQILMMGGSILGPGTIFLMLVGAFVAAFKGIDNVTSLTFNSIPILLYIAVCYFFKGEIQLIFAQLLSAIYALVMVAVLVALSLQIAEDGLLAPSSIFLIAVALSFIVSAILHPLEFDCLVHGLVYYITIPSMYLLLIIYSLFNLNNVSWGTREVATKKSAADVEAEAKAAEAAAAESKKAAKSGFWGFLPGGGKGKDDSEGSIEFNLAGLFKIMCCVKPKPVDEQMQLVRIADALAEVTRRLESIEKNVDGPTRRDSQVNRKSNPTPSASSTTNKAGLEQRNLESSIKEEFEGDSGPDDLSSHSSKSVKEKPRDELINPYWIDDKSLLRGYVDFLTGTEISFWNKLISKYLFPLPKDEAKEKKLAAQLIDLRNQSVSAFFMINAVFVLAIFLLQLNKDILFIEWPLGVKVNMTTTTDSNQITISKEYLQLEPIGLVFVSFFAIILIVQFTAMLFHRFGTLSHILAATPLITHESAFEVRGIHEIKKMQKLNSPSGEDKANQRTDPGRRKTIHMLEEKRTKPEIATLDRKFKTTFKKLGESIDREPSVVGSRFRTTFQELQRRRSTVMLNRRNSIIEQRKSKIVTLNEPNREQYNQSENPTDAASAAFRAHNSRLGVPNPGYVPDVDEFPAGRFRRPPAPPSPPPFGMENNGMPTPGRFQNRKAF